jgi:hypothetical protein
MVVLMVMWVLVLAWLVRGCRWWWWWLEVAGVRSTV